MENGVAEKYRGVPGKKRRKVFFNNLKKEVSLHNIYKFKPLFPETQGFVL
jgi:hypothetical protein